MTARHVALIDASGDTTAWLTQTLHVTPAAWEAGAWAGEQLSAAVGHARERLPSPGCTWRSVPVREEVPA